MNYCELESECENFAIKCSLLQNELEFLLEKTKKIEAILTKIVGDPQVSTVDFYRPDPAEETPPKKKMRRE